MVNGALVCLVLLAAICLHPFPADTAGGMDTLPPKAAVLVSRNIRPYMEAVEGLNDALNKAAGTKAEVFFLEKYRGRDLDGLSGKLSGGGFDIIAAIGPGAARLAWGLDLPDGPVVVYTMVLNPEKVPGHSVSACGITLNIPVKMQLEMISRGLPGTGRTGLLYDPGHNSGFYAEAVREAGALGLEIVPLAVSSKKEIPSVLKRHWEKVDTLWLVPDRTVISESIVQYVIKEALLRKVVVAGYNRFFYESGAALAFVFNYEDLGRQCAGEALRILSGGQCRQSAPAFHVWINERVINRIGMKPSSQYVPPMEPGP